VYISIVKNLCIFWVLYIYNPELFSKSKRKYGKNMPCTVLLTFNNHEKRDEFLAIVRTTADGLLASASGVDDGNLLMDTLKSLKLDPPIKTDQERIVALFVSGRKKSEGMLSDMQKQFALEAGSHSASVELKELRGGQWLVIQSRKFQKN